MLTGPVLLVGGGGDGKCVSFVVSREEKTGTAFRHNGFQCAVFSIALDIHDEFITGIVGT